MSRKYEYVKWEEARPVKMELNRINQKMFSYINSNHPELCFEARVIGSGKRGLNTRVVNGNKGFDFDFNLIIDAPPEGKVWVADVVKQIFMEAADYAVKGTNYSHPKDSTRAITVKVVDKKNSKIKHSRSLRDNKKQNAIMLSIIVLIALAAIGALVYLFMTMKG